MMRHRSVYCNLLHVAIKIMPGEGFLFRHLLRNTCLGNFVNTHSQNNQVFYPLGIAIHAHNRDAFLLLVENGAKFSINGERDKTTLGQAQVPHFSAILRYCSWACFEDEHVVRYLVDAGAPFNTLSPEGIAPLQDALLVGSFKLAKMLISLGADINEVIPDDSNGAFSEHVKGYTLMGALLSDYFLYSFRDIVASIRYVQS